MTRQHWNNTSRKGRKNERAGTDRPEQGKIFSGVAEMSDEEFRARCDMTRPTITSIATSGRGVKHGKFPLNDAARNTDMAEYS